MTMTIQARLFRHCHHYSTTLLVPAHRQHGIATSIPQYYQLVSSIGSKKDEAAMVALLPLPTTVHMTDQW
jgi:hypothetical protein